MLEFSENVRLGGCSKDLLSMYQATQEGTTSERETALNELVEALRRNIDLKIKESGLRPSVVRGNPGVSEDKWAVDFSKAQVVNEEGKVQLIFPNEENGGCVWRAAAPTSSRSTSTPPARSPTWAAMRWTPRPSRWTTL